MKYVSVCGNKYSPTDDEKEPFAPQKKLRSPAELCEAITPSLQDVLTPEEHKEPGVSPTGTGVQCEMGTGYNNTHTHDFVFYVAPCVHFYRVAEAVSQKLRGLCRRRLPETRWLSPRLHKVQNSVASSQLYL